MSFEQNLKERINNAPFGSERRNILKLVLGEHQQLAAKQAMKDEHGHNIVKKIIEANDKSLSYLEEGDLRARKLRDENDVLRELLPRYLSKEEIVVVLRDLDLKSCKSAGQAMGMAMKHLAGRSVEGNTVKEAVAELRG
tara:strand:+ start:94 stop:510 length:417 start_codon:yes stop_codon:yes gene_type:complete